MAGRTFAIGDIHGETQHLFRLMSCLPKLDEHDTLVFLGDYLDRGPHSREVVEYLMNLPRQTKAKVVCLRGNHEDSWLRVRKVGWDEFVLPPANGCFAAYRSFVGGPVPETDQQPTQADLGAMCTASFFPEDVVRWLDALSYWYEDEHAIYVHAGLPRAGDRFAHPSEVADPLILLWIRTEEFFRKYRGKPVVFGHTRTEFLPQELSSYTPEDPTDLFAGENAYGVDTGCGQGGFLTALEFPALRVYESR
jgi:serine/threonine protein phosphatase 1